MPTNGVFMTKTPDVTVRQEPVKRHFQQNRSSGFTLIELVIVIVIVALGVALAVPSFRDVVEKRRLSFAAEQVSTLLTFAQSTAVKHNSDVIVNFRYNNHDTWCIGATLGTTACNCFDTDSAQATFCEIEVVARRLDQTEVLPNTTYDLMHQISINGTSITNDTIVFDPVRGTVADLDIVNIQMHSHQGSDANAGSRNYQLEVDILPTGRVSICTQSGQKKLLKQYPEC